MNASIPSPSAPAPHAPGRSFGGAWLALTLALALHVVDEAANGFLSFYNPTVAALRDRVPWLWLPTFTFPVWIAGLGLAIVVLLALTPLAFRGRRGLRWFAVLYAVLMAANGLVHPAASVVFDRLVPGLWSSPLLFLAAVWLLVAALHQPAGRSGAAAEGPASSQSSP